MNDYKVSFTDNCGDLYCGDVYICARNVEECFEKFKKNPERKGDVITNIIKL